MSPGYHQEVILKNENIYAYQKLAHFLLKGSLGKFIHFKALKLTFSLGGDMGTPNPGCSGLRA